ncbi:hypothetical protein [Clostridium felsineum]|uniref:hypothetical protein n=1 Tax=Clostridium felsineum TaxID=36839 RepID=UPI00098BE7DF|nr:hypothetical protein [Clostridium felsineum]URZ03770.1 hypothetical protein CLAUR_038350 [Clostridium felsineum]
MLDIFGMEESKKIKSIDEVVQATMKWHFSEETGSEFWLNKKKKLSFDPIKDIKKFEQLNLFDDYTEEMKNIDVTKFIPRGLKNFYGDVNVFESGGTTGSPQRIIDTYSRRKALDWVDKHFIDFGVSKELEGNWIHVGPTGPHIVGTSIGRLAKSRQKVCYYIDFDPRWVKKISKLGQKDIVVQYVNHILDQVEDILRTQNISVMFITPAVLEALSKRQELCEIINKKISTIIWAGTSMSEENLYAFENYIFENINFIGLYGNTLMGIAPQRKRNKDDKFLCVYQSFYPFSVVEVVDKTKHNQLVEYSATGQICVTLMTPDIFIPKHLERDQAVRIKPVDGYLQDGVADLKPLDSIKGKIFEGVY